MSCLAFHVSVMLAQTTTETKELRFQRNSQDQTLVISNMRGAIDVESYNGNTIQVEMIKTIKAKNRKDYEHALTEVKVLTEVNQLDNLRRYTPYLIEANGSDINVGYLVSQKFSNPKVTALVKKGEVIATMRNIFGDLMQEYLAPEDGIVIGKSVSPVNQTGGRILHLGILK